MDHYQQAKHGAELDSRRVSTGVHCRMISELEEKPSLKGLLFLLKKFNHVPAHAEIHPIKGYDGSSGIALVIPLNFVEFVSKQLVIANNSILDRDNLDASTLREDPDAEFDNRSEFFSYQEKVQTELMRNIREHIILVTLDNFGQFGVPNASKHDVYVHTLEQAPARGEIVPKTTRITPAEKNSSWMREA